MDLAGGAVGADLPGLCGKGDAPLNVFKRCVPFSGLLGGVEEVLDQLAAAGTLFLTLSGGELLLRKDFFPLLAHARRLQAEGAEVRTVTIPNLNEFSGINRVISSTVRPCSWPAM